MANSLLANCNSIIELKLKKKQQIIRSNDMQIHAHSFKSKYTFVGCMSGIKIS